MNLDKIDIVVNGKTATQAVNLGFITARRYYPTLLKAGFIAVTPFFLVATLIVLFFEHYLSASLLIWWGKPYYDRVILLQGSRLLFREQVSVSDIFRSLKTALTPGLVANLTWGRFSFIRGVSLPISQLEKQSGKAYRSRVNAIGQSSKSTMSSVTIGLLHFDMFLYINLFLLVLMLLPEAQRSGAGTWFISGKIDADNPMQWLVILMLFCQSIGSVVIEIFYVMIGFMLYLNNRITMEGWGIELGFKRMAERLGGVSKKSVMLLNIVGLSLILGLVAMPQRGVSAENASILVSPEKDKAQLKAILQDDDISPFVPTVEWKKKNDKDEAEAPKKTRTSSTKNMKEIADAMKFIIIAAVVIMGLLGVYQYRAIWQFISGSKKIEEDNSPQVMFGLAVTPDSLPQDVGKAAKQLWVDGDFLGALSLLYRSSLSSLINGYQANIKESHTEGDCLRIGKDYLPDDSYHCFAELTALWQNVVYAHHSPDADVVEALINQWQAAFSRHVDKGVQNES